MNKILHKKKKILMKKIKKKKKNKNNFKLELLINVDFANSLDD